MGLTDEGSFWTCLSGGTGTGAWCNPVHYKSRTTPQRCRNRGCDGGEIQSGERAGMMSACGEPQRGQWRCGAGPAAAAGAVAAAIAARARSPFMIQRTGLVASKAEPVPCKAAPVPPSWRHRGISTIRAWGTWRRMVGVPAPYRGMNGHRRRPPRCRRSSTACCTPRPGRYGPLLLLPPPPPPSTLPPATAASSTSATTQRALGWLAANTGSPAPWFTGGTATPSLRLP